MARSSFGKREREQAKRAKAAAKRDRRQQAAEEGGEPETPAAVESTHSSDDIINQLATLHRDYDEGRVSYDDFQETKADLLGRLTVE